MAYLFNSINSQIDQKPKTDIFNPGSTQAAQAGGQSDVFQTANTSSTPNAPSGGSSAAPAAAGMRGSGSGGGTPTASQQSKAWGSIAGPDASRQTSKISGDIARADQRLKDEANLYQGKATNEAAGYGLNDLTLQRAAQGDDKAYNETAQRLGKSAPTPFESFQGLGSKDLPSSADVLASPSNFGEVFRPTASAGYTGGESRLNTLLLRKSPEFRQTAAQLLGDQQNVIKASDKAKVDETKKAQDMLNQKYGEETQAARDRLKGFGDEVIGDAKAKEAYIEGERSKLDPSQLSAEQFQTLAAELKGLYGNADPASEQARMLEYLNDPSAFDLSKYGKVNTDIDHTSLIDQQGADTFNRINALLGSNGPLMQKGAGMGDAFSFDKAGAAEDLYGQLLGKRQSEDRSLKEQIAATQAGAGTRAGAGQGDALKNAQDYVTRKYLEQNEGQSPEQQRAEQEAFRQLFNPETNWSPYYTADGGLKTSDKPRTAADMITPQEAAQMNEMAKKAGTGQSFTAGSQYNETNYDPGYFDKRFQTTFDRILGELGGTVPMTSNQGTASSSELGQGLGRDRTVNPLVAEQEAAKSEAAIQDLLRRLPNRLRR